MALKKIKNKVGYLFIIVGTILFFFGIFLLIDKENNNNNLKKIEKISIDNFIETQQETINNSSNSINNEQDNKKIIKYNAVLEIPKIGLKKGLVNKNSSQNNVNKNIYVLKESIFPDNTEISHIILASHSGNSSVSFFKNLNKLEKNDYIYLYYKNFKYIYRIINIKEIEKNGTLQLDFNDKSDITLVTCIMGTKKQIVYIANLVENKKY